MADAVEGHSGVTLEVPRKKTGRGVGSANHGIVCPNGSAICRDMEKLVVIIHAEVVGHHHIVLPAGGVDRRRDLGLGPGIAVLIDLNVIKRRTCDRALP